MYELILKEADYRVIRFRFSDKKALSNFMFEALERHSLNEDDNGISVEIKKCAEAATS